MTQEWEPRDPDFLIGDTPWLARMSDKARAKVAGTIGDYIYPCPLDKQLLRKLGLSADEFMQLAIDHPTDEGLVKALQERVRQGSR
ncbi:MAG: DUF5069 domain-containing protein [Limnochordia bacterium]